jgi:hypothetical protein
VLPLQQHDPGNDVADPRAETGVVEKGEAKVEAL